MAKSGKSNKATSKEKQSVEKPEDAEKVVSEVETKLSNAEKTDDVSLDDIAVETPSPDDADTPEPADSKEASDAETVEELLEDEALDSVAEAEAEMEQELYGEADPDTEDADAEKLDADEAEVLDADEIRDPDATEENSEAQEQDDTVEEPEPVETQPVAEPKPAPQPSGGSMWPSVFGGVIAALIGFIVGRGDVIDNYLPSAFQRPDIDLTVVDDLAAQTEALSAQAEELATQTQTQVSRIEALEAVSAQAILESVASLETDLETVAARLEALEARPIAVETVESEDANAASAEELAALQTALEEQKAQIADLVESAKAAEARAAEEASQILARAALTRVVTAVDSGQSFAPALTDLEEVTPVEVPAALREAAEAGVPSMASLQDSFPDAARAGLSAARDEVPEIEVEGITGFLKRQLNARSVTPREGADPDAILSRAQAAVRAGDLGTALSEMDALPEAARSAMADWLDAATARKAAQDAANELADSLNSN